MACSPDASERTAEAAGEEATSKWQDIDWNVGTFDLPKSEKEKKNLNVK